jgi:hypothetical protein
LRQSAARWSSLWDADRDGDGTQLRFARGTPEFRYCLKDIHKARPNRSMRQYGSPCRWVAGFESKSVTANWGLPRAAIVLHRAATGRGSSMPLKIIRAHFNALSFIVGETVCVTFQFSGTEDELANIQNISVNFLRCERERDQSALGFGTLPTRTGSTFEVSQILPETLKTGLYACANVSVTGLERSNIQTLTFEPIFFVIRTAVELPITDIQLTQLIQQRSSERAAYESSVITAPGASAGGSTKKEYQIFVFASGCLLHSVQQLQGFSLAPIGQGLSHRRMHDLVNFVLVGHGFEALPFLQETESRFAFYTQTFFVSYPRVEAVDHVDALDHCRAHSRVIFEILGLDRSQMPREFACVALETGTTQRWHWYSMPGFRGNVIAGLNPVSTANSIERMMPKLLGNPFGRLLMSTYAEATAEMDYGFALLRYWSVLELVADKIIVRKSQICHSDGTPVLNEDGEAETTRTKVGRVYAYIMSMGAYAGAGSYQENGVSKKYVIGDKSNPNYDASSDLYSLWLIVKATYAIRNAVAHEGQFDVARAAVGDTYQKTAARLRAKGQPDLLDFIRSQAKNAIWRNV